MVTTLKCPSHGCNRESRYYLRLTEHYEDNLYPVAAVDIKNFDFTKRSRGRTDGWDLNLRQEQ
jgi:hypothetical protein